MVSLSIFNTRDFAQVKHEWRSQRRTWWEGRARCKWSIRMHVGTVTWVMQGGWVCYSTESSYLVSLALLRALGWAESLPMGAGRLPATLPWLRASQGTLRVLWQEETLQETIPKRKINLWTWKFVPQTKYWCVMILKVFMPDFRCFYVE